MMVTETPNLKLKKPAGSDLVDISVLNGNMDTLDRALVVSAEDYVENAHVWFRNTLWAKTVQCDNLSTSGNFTAGWLQSKSVADLNAVPNLYPVFRDDKWIYLRTRAEMISDLGIDKCALKSDISAVYKAKGSCTTSELASKAKETGDVWNLTDAGQYGPAGTNVLWTGTEWDALSGIVDLSSYAKKSDIPDISRKLDKSGGAMTGYLSDKTVLQVRNVMTATEKPADTVGQDGDICFVIKA